jgi:radical SAM superfamily enzyme YgiQ (UPF0313 family)
MDYVGSIFRPPAEHDSVLLQVTIGCSNNRCAFCGMYMDKSFAIKDMNLIERDIDEIAFRQPGTKRIFLCDGDALSIPQDKLSSILESIGRKIPGVRRVGAYAGVHGLAKKSASELAHLKELGLRILYFGLETGDDEVLAMMTKGADVASQVREARKIVDAGIKCSVTVLLGLGGMERSERHALLTGSALSAIDPDYVGALSLMLVPGTRLCEMEREGRFVLPGAKAMLVELKTMIEHTELSYGVLSANHASNYLPFQVHLPGQKKEAIALLDAALAGVIGLKPEMLRGL